MAAVAFLNSLADSPRLRASLGSLAAPKRSMTIARTMMSSVGPRFTAKPFGREGPSVPPGGSPGGTPAYGCLCLLAASGLLDGGPDAEVRPATAQVATHGLVDVSVTRVGVLVEQGNGLHDLAGLAVAALGHVVVNPGCLDRVQGVALSQTLDSGDVLTFDRAHGRNARALGHTIDVAGADAAQAHTAPVLDAIHVQAVTKDPLEFLVLVGVDRDRVAIEVECDHRHRNQAPYSLRGKFRGCLPVARAQALAAAPAAAGTPSSPTPPGVTLLDGRIDTLMSGVESNIRVHL